MSGARATLTAMHRSKPALSFVFFTLLLDVLGFGLLIPVAPKLIAVVRGLPPEGAEHDASLAVGLLFAMYAAMQFIFSPILGSLSDRFGRRPVLLIALFGSGLDYFAATQAPHVTEVFGAVTGMTFLFITRAINGISGATIPVCSAYIADVTPPEKRAAGFGIIGAAFGAGFAFGPLIGGALGDEKTPLPLLGHGHITYPYYAAGALILEEAGGRIASLQHDDYWRPEHPQEWSKSVIAARHPALFDEWKRWVRNHL